MFSFTGSDWIDLGLRRNHGLSPHAPIKHNPGSKDGLKVTDAYAFERVHDRPAYLTEVDLEPVH